MNSEPEKSERNFRPFLWLGIALALVIVLWLSSPYVASWWSSLLGSNDKHGCGNFSEQFGVMNSLFTGLAFAALVVTIYQQQKGLRQQREELEMQREELHLQREELKHSVAEMKRSANAQTAQVRINTMSALLASLPVLIREEENRALALDPETGGFGIHDNLRSYTLKDLENRIEKIRERIKTSPATVKKLEEKHRIAIQNQEHIEKKNFTTPNTQTILAREKSTKAKEMLDNERTAAEIAPRLAETIERLVTLRRELSSTYEQMKEYQDWGESGVPAQTANSGTSSEDDA